MRGRRWLGWGRAACRRHPKSTVSTSTHHHETAAAVVSGHVRLEALLDTGANVSLVSVGMLKAQEKADGFLEVAIAAKPVELAPLGNERMLVSRRVRLRNVELSTTAGPLMLPVLECWIDNKDPKQSLILGRPVMHQLGYSTDGLLSSAALRKMGVETVPEDVGKVPNDEPEEVPVVDEAGEKKPFASHQAKTIAALKLPEDEPDAFDERMELPSPKPASMDEVHEVLLRRHAAAVTAGLPKDAAAMLAVSLRRYDKAFRLQIGCDPPVKVTPLKVRLKPDAQPVKCSARRLSPLHANHVAKHIKELVDAGYLRRNNRSRHASPPRVVAKSTPGEFRMTIDLRAQNQNTIPMPWPMPVLEAVLAFLAAARCFFNLDADKRFWQLPLDEETQELYTIMTTFGMFSPTRVLMGQTDAVAFCQATVEEIFELLLNHEVLVWFDDVLGHAPNPVQLMKILDRVLAQCVKYGLKLNPNMCLFYSTEIKWWSRIVSAKGISHCPERIAGLVAMLPPRTGGDIQQLVCATNWMRASIPQYAQLVAPVMELLETAAKRAVSRKKRTLNRVPLEDLWEERHAVAFDGLKTALSKITPLAHPQADATVCVFTDASLDHWRAAATQLDSEDESRPITDQTHKPLAFLSGSFSGSSARWPIVEKEAFAIVETCKRLDYLLLREKGFSIFTDHRNLVYIFDPRATDANMARFQADKLQRWSVTMMMFRYVIYHISGDDNVWGDLLSRWGAAVHPTHRAKLCALAVVDLMSPLQSADFDWPSLAQVLELQQGELRSRCADEPLPEVTWNEDDQVFKTASGQVWIPDSAVDMQQRLCVVAHAGAAGHRGQAATLKMLKECFVWSTMTDDVATFIKACIHCLMVKGEVIPQPFGQALHATKPNELLHFDILSMPLGSNVSQYVLVLKDDLSGFVELMECATADSEEVTAALLHWFNLFGVVLQWISDQGSHFKSKVIEDLRRVLGGHHRFVVAYSPWANGTVEVVNRMVLRVVKALLSELKMRPAQWPVLMPVVQVALNMRPADRLGGIAPVTAFTQLPATTPLTVLFHPTTKKTVTVDWVREEQKRNLDDAAQALEKMHKALSETAVRKRAVARARHEAKNGVEMPKFAEGDFVLVNVVTSRANKLALQWRGPRCIIRVIHDHTYEVQDLCPPYGTSIHHASRMQWYAEKSREVTTDLLDHVRHTEGGHLIEKMLDTRIGPDTHELQVKVQWIGLDPLEASWEPAAELFKDVPVLLAKFVETMQAGKLKTQLEAMVSGATTDKSKRKGKSKASKT